MWSIDEIKQYIKENISSSRYVHTLGVVEMAKHLAVLNNECEEKAEVAALIHDIAKSMPIDKQIEILKNNNFELDKITLNSPQILHGFVGAIIAKELMNITDEDIINAIKYHTIGKAYMTTLEKIVYIADYIEPNRNYPGVEELREITKNNLNLGVLQGLENTIIHVIKQKQLVHPQTMEARNFLLLEINKK